MTTQPRKLKAALAVTCIALLGVGVLAVFMDAVTLDVNYELEPATVRKVVPNPPWKYIACDEMTLVRFDDGLDVDMGGNRGEPGDRILAPRPRGTRSIFGIFGRPQK